MKPLKQTGFTIVETMLFLGITGLLVMGVLVGTGTAINIQRYRDSVSSLRSFLQQQYSEVANTSNDGSGDSCGAQPRGQSDSVILGKYITSRGDNNTVIAKTVIGTIPATNPGANDISALQAYDIQISSLAEATYGLEWGSSMDRKAGEPMEFSMLILRSPTSGIIRTFIDSSRAITDNNIASLLTAAPSALDNDATICLNSNGLFTGTKMAVYVQKNATSSNGVVLLGDNSGCR